MEQMKIRAYSWQVHQPDIQCSGHLYQLSNDDIQEGEACGLSENVPFSFYPEFLLAQAHGSHSQILI